MATIETFYVKDGFVKGELHRTNNILVLIWENTYLPLPDMKELHGKITDLAKQYNIKVVLATGKTGGIFDDVLKWWIEIEVPAYIRAGIKAIITVKGGTALARAGNNQWQKPIIGKLENIEVPTREDALLLATRIK